MALTLYHLAWYFVLYSFLGWCLEVVFCTVNTGKLVNRGFLNGPVCPIYGFGMVLVVVILGGIADNLLLLFFGGMLLTSALELFGGWALEKFFHTRWWDYTDQPFNIGGYVCLKFSLAWGFACVAVMRGLHPLIDGLVGLVPMIPGIILLVVCLCAFLADAIVTVITINKLNRHLGVISDIASGLHKGSDALSNNLGTLALAADDKIEAGSDVLRTKAAEGKEAITEKATEGKDAIVEKLTALGDTIGDKVDQAQDAAEEMRKAWTQRTTGLQRRMQGRLLDAFPGMKSERDDDSLRRVRVWYEEKKKK